MKWKFNYTRPESAHTDSMRDSIRLGFALKAILRTRGLTLKEVSLNTGIPYSTLHTWLENRQPKDILKVKRLADYLGVGLSELLFGETEEIDLAPGLPMKDTISGVYEVIVRKRKDLP